MQILASSDPQYDFKGMIKKYLLRNFLCWFLNLLFIIQLLLLKSYE